MDGRNIPEVKQPEPEDDFGIPICPITLNEIVVPAKLSCGHVIENENVKKIKDCPCCRKPIASASIDHELQKSIASRKKVRQENIDLKNEVARLKAQMVQLLSQDGESKHQASIPVELTIPLRLGENAAQKFADKFKHQQDLVVKKVILGKFLRGRFIKFADLCAQTKAQKKEILARHTAMQKQLKTLLVQCVEKLNPSEEKSQAEEINSLMGLLEKDIEETQQEIASLLLSYKQRVFQLSLPQFSRKWVFWDENSKNAAKELQALQAEQEREFAVVYRTCCERGQNLPVMFGRPTSTAAGPLDYAQLQALVKMNDVDQAEKLLKRRHFNLDAPGDNFLLKAIIKKSPEMVKLFIRYNANVNAQVVCADKKKEQPGFLEPLLVAAVRHRDIEPIAALLSSPKIDPNLVDDNQDTALHWAAYQKREDIIKLLLKHPKKPNPLLENKNRRTPFSEGHIENNYDSPSLQAAESAARQREALRR